MNLPPEAMGAAPAQGNPNAPKNTLPPQAIAALKKDPEILQAIALFMGRPVPDISHLPDNVITELAGMVAKLGPRGAAQMLEQKIPADIKAKIKAAV
jgi:hypothetical protein